MRKEFLVAGAFLSISMSAEASQPLARHKGLIATAEPNFDCGKPSSIAVTAPNNELFQGDKIALNILLAAVRSNLEAKCPGGKAPDLIVRGLVADKEVYRGAFNSGTDWILIDLAVPAAPAAPSPDKVAGSTSPPPAEPPKSPAPVAQATAPPSGTLAGSWQGTLKNRDGQAQELKLRLVEKGGVAEFEGFFTRCSYAVEPFSRAGESRNLFLFPQFNDARQCAQDAELAIKPVGQDLAVTVSVPNDAFAGTLVLNLGPVDVTAARMPSVPLETGGFSMAMPANELQSKIAEVYGTKSAFNGKEETTNNSVSFLGFKDKEQAFIPQRYRDEDHIMEVLTVGASPGLHDKQREPPWLMRIWAPPRSEAPTAKMTVSSITEKYGPPSFKRQYEGRGYDPDDTELEWHFDLAGKLLTGKGAEACRRTQKNAAVTLPMTRGWQQDIGRIDPGIGRVAINPGCGYSIIVIVDAVDAGALNELSVGFYNQPRVLGGAWANMSFNISVLAQGVLQAHAQRQENKPKL